MRLLVKVVHQPSNARVRKTSYQVHCPPSRSVRQLLLHGRQVDPGALAPDQPVDEVEDVQEAHPHRRELTDPSAPRQKGGELLALPPFRSHERTTASTKHPARCGPSKGEPHPAERERSR